MLYKLRRTELLFFAGLGLFVVMILTQGRAVKEGTVAGLRTLLLVLPGIFPSLVLSGLIVRSGAALRFGGGAARLFERVFRLPGAALPAAALSLISGFPTGAKCAADLYGQGRLSKEEAERLAAFTDFPSPPFLVATVGQGIFNNAAVGWTLFALQSVFALIFGMFWRRPCREEFFARTKSGARGRGEEIELSVIPGSIGDAASRSVQIAGFILFFSIVSTALYEALFSRFPALEGGKALFYGFFEISSGIARLSGEQRGSGVFSALILGFSGVSVLMQCASFLCEKGLSMRPLLISHLLCPVFTAAVMFALGFR